jgi:hypothetical protein
MGRQTGRYRRGQPDYGDVDLERALVPSMNLSPAEMAAGMPGMPGVPGVPGMPAEDVERLLGIRRPVYIPATGNKRKFRVGSWRVISGVLSIIFVCLASCAGASILGKNYFAGLTKVPSIGSSAPPIDYSSVPATPVATMGAQGVGTGNGAVGAKYISSVTTSKRIDSSINPVNVTSHFLTGDTVYVVVDVRNAPAGSNTICINWYLNNQYLQLPSTSETCNTIKDANQNVVFYIAYGQPAVGMARIYWNRPASDTSTAPNDPNLAATIIFGIYEPATPTTVPRTPTGTPNKTPTVTPTKTPVK